MAGAGRRQNFAPGWPGPNQCADYVQGLGQDFTSVHGCYPHPTPPLPSIVLFRRLAAPRTAPTSTMIARSSACRVAPRAVCRQSISPAQRRGLAAPASGSFTYQTGEGNGIKFASRDFAGPTTTLALVSKAGTRYERLPGLTEGLANFAFRVRH
jgi:hypothetical protein